MNQEIMSKVDEKELSGREGNKAPFHSGAGIGGYFVLLGIIFMLGAIGTSIFGRSAWMLVALLPAYWIGMAAYRRYRHDGRFSRQVLAISFWGMLPFAYILAAFLGFNIGTLWPLGFIGISYLIYGSGK